MTGGAQFDEKMHQRGAQHRKANGKHREGQAGAPAAVQIRNARGAVKGIFGTIRGNFLFRASASEINALLVTRHSADTLNGRKIHVYGRLRQNRERGRTCGRSLVSPSYAKVLSRLIRNWSPYS